MNKEKILKEISKLLDKYQTSNLKLEDHNFKVNSDGWKKITVDDVEYLENPEGDIWEILENEARGEQLFTWKSAMRETKKQARECQQIVSLQNY